MFDTVYVYACTLYIVYVQAVLVKNYMRASCSRQEGANAGNCQIEEV